MRVLFATLAASMLATFYGVPEPILSLRLKDYDLDDTQTGLIFGIEAFTYMLSTFLVPYVVPAWVEPRITIITSSIICTVATTLIGPFYTETSLVAMCIGLAVSGFMLSFMFILNMTECMAAMEEKHPHLAGKDKTNSMLSGMLNAMYALGQFIGPLLGAYGYQLTDDNFRLTMNMTAGLGAVFCLCYIIFAGGCQSLAQTCRNYRNKTAIAEAEEVRKDSRASSRVHSLVLRQPMITDENSAPSLRKASKVSLGSSKRRLHSMAHSYHSRHGSRHPSGAEDGQKRRVATSISDNPLLEESCDKDFEYKVVDPYEPKF